MAAKRREPPPSPRLEGHDCRMLATRQYAALLTGRHPDLIRKHCQPAACDTATRLPMYDLDAVKTTFTGVSRRTRLTSRAA